MLRRSLICFATALFVSTPPAAQAEGSSGKIVLDGRIDEAAWQTAIVQKDFVRVVPFAQDASPHATEARILSTAEGLYLGFRNHQPANSLRSARHPRDSEQSEADAVLVALDVDASGRQAWFFHVSLGNSIKDGSITDEVDWRFDWDGDWSARTAITPEGWEAELFLPWSVLPMPATEASSRPLRVALVRKFAALGQEVAWPAAHWERPTFISDFAAIEIPAQTSRAQLDLFPYLTGSYDALKSESDFKLGLDAVWKQHGTQITATLNPDFGQVESDELVVNFSAIETFQSEKRPFFTENNTLFSLQGPQELQLVHTRRIGASADTGKAGLSDIRYALKAMHTGQLWDAGFFSTQEDDPVDSLGRRYDVARLVYKQDQLSLGYLGTQTERPALRRNAQVDAVDLQWRGQHNWQVAGALFQSRVEETRQTTTDQGMFAVLRYNPTPDHSHLFEWVRYGKDLQVRDLGYVERVDLHRVYYSHERRSSEFAAGHPTQERALRGGFYLSENLDGRALWNGVQFAWEESFRSTRRAEVDLWLYDEGLEDQEARGQGLYRFPAGLELTAEWAGSEDGAFRLHHEMEIKNEGIDHYQITAHTHPGWVFNDQINLMWGFWYTHSDEWLLWRDDHLASYSREQWLTRIDLNWNFDDHNELRLGWQWLALKAEGLRRYRISNERLVDDGAEREQLLRGELAFQLRYLHRFGPLSALHLVYSRGGAEDPEDAPSGPRFRDVFSQSLNNITAETLLFKLRLHW